MSVPDLSKLGQPKPEDDGIPDIGEFMPSEENIAKLIMVDINKKWNGKPMTEENQLAMGNEIIDRFASELGLRVALGWADVVPDMRGGDDLYYIPQIIALGRIERVETDHDRLMHEIRSGEADGRAGVLREDGSFREDAKSTDYY